MSLPRYKCLNVCLNVFLHVEEDVQILVSEAGCLTDAARPDVIKMRKPLDGDTQMCTVPNEFERFSDPYVTNLIRRRGCDTPSTVRP